MSEDERLDPRLRRLLEDPEFQREMRARAEEMDSGAPGLTLDEVTDMWEAAHPGVTLPRPWREDPTEQRSC